LSAKEKRGSAPEQIILDEQRPLEIAKFRLHEKSDGSAKAEGSTMEGALTTEGGIAKIRRRMQGSRHDFEVSDSFVAVKDEGLAVDTRDEGESFVRQTITTEFWSDARQAKATLTDKRLIQLEINGKDAMGAFTAQGVIDFRPERYKGLADFLHF